MSVIKPQSHIMTGYHNCSLAQTTCLTCNRDQGDSVSIGHFLCSIRLRLQTRHLQTGGTRSFDNITKKNKIDLKGFPDIYFKGVKLEIKAQDSLTHTNQQLFYVYIYRLRCFSFHSIWKRLHLLLFFNNQPVLFKKTASFLKKKAFYGTQTHTLRRQRPALKRP